MTASERPNVVWRGRGVLCMVTPGESRLAGVAAQDSLAREAALVVKALAAIRAGIDLLQIREPSLEARSLLRVVTSAVEASRGSSTRVVVNDRLDVALAAGADGVHLGGRSLPAGRVRSEVPEGFLIGRSVHTLDEACEVAAEGAADYLIAGTVFPSASKPDAATVLGLGGLAEIVGRVAMPVLAIGGITLEAIADVARAGAAGVAAIGLFADAADLDRTVRQARRRFDTVGAIP